MGDEARVARVRELYAEYEYGILDGSAVVPESRLREIERLIAAETPVLVQLAEEALASRAVVAAARAILADGYFRALGGQHVVSGERVAALRVALAAAPAREEV